MNSFVVIILWFDYDLERHFLEPILIII